MLVNHYLDGSSDSIAFTYVSHYGCTLTFGFLSQVSKYMNKSLSKTEMKRIDEKNRKKAAALSKEAVKGGSVYIVQANSPSRGLLMSNILLPLSS